MEQAASPSPGLELSARAARAADERAIREWGIPSFALMESAGRACADEVQAILAMASPLDPADRKEALVLCGPGNNGGDGLVIARTLVNRGVPARIVTVGSAARLEQAGEDVQRNLQLWRDLGHGLDELTCDAEFESFEALLEQATIVVDALFGTGLTRPLGGDYARCVQAVEKSGRGVLAVDLPSGLHADTGEVLGISIKASVTVTFVAPKLGFRRGAGPGHVGRVKVAEIGIPLVFAERAAREFPGPN